MAEGFGLDCGVMKSESLWKGRGYFLQGIGYHEGAGGGSRLRIHREGTELRITTETGTKKWQNPAAQSLKA